MASLAAFQEQAVRNWLKASRGRDQNGPMSWERFRPLMAFFVPRPKFEHPYPNERFDAKHPR